MSKINWGQASVAGLNKTVLEEKERLEKERNKSSSRFTKSGPVNHTETNKNIIYVLDRLLQISINGDAIQKSRNIDLSLYKVLNSPRVNQEIIHLGCLPIARENKNTSNEFAHFIKDLLLYMEYDINTDFLWAATMSGLTPDKEKQESIYQKIISIRKEIVQYLFDKELISNEEYNIQLKYKVKELTGRSSKS